MTGRATIPMVTRWFQGPRTRVPDLLVLARIHRRAAMEEMLEHRHDPERLEILYVARGPRQYVVNGTPHLLEGNDVLVVPPNATHSSGGVSQGKCTLYVVVVRLRDAPGGFLCLRGKAADQLRHALRELRGGAFPGRLRMRATLEEALSTCAAARNSPLSVAGVASAVTAFLVDVVRCARQYRARSRSPWTQRLLDYIEANLDRPLRIRDMAQAMKRSESYVKHRFRREMGLSPADHVLRRKIERAKDRLARTDATITQIAMDLGFSTSQHFATTFRRYVGLSPLAYRRTSRR